MLLVMWHQQLLVQNVVFHLYFGPNCRTLQRGLCATYVIVKIWQYHLDLLYCSTVCIEEIASVEFEIQFESLNHVMSFMNMLVEGCFKRYFIWCSLQAVSMDTAENAGAEGQERAFSVEECVCPAGYRGLSCEVW